VNELEKDIATINHAEDVLGDPRIGLLGMMLLYEKYAAPRVRAVSEQIIFKAITGKDRPS
jgi:hypothetical protein